MNVYVNAMRVFVCNLHGKTNRGDTCESSWLDQSQWALNKNILSKHKGGCYCTQSGSLDLSFLSEKKLTKQNKTEQFCGNNNNSCKVAGTAIATPTDIGLPKKDYHLV